MFLKRLCINYIHELEQFVKKLNIIKLSYTQVIHRDSRTDGHGDAIFSGES